MLQRGVGDAAIAAHRQPLQLRVARPMLAPDPDEAAAQIRAALAERADAAIGDEGGGCTLHRVAGDPRMWQHPVRLGLVVDVGDELPVWAGSGLERERD